ncbi:cation diffusion facilitator family transporter [Candidatus Mycosynbacter amalyticus]|uniref:Cation diffusion facilitator family transporter n=1 Tax=Candidatus Mycosynbacter amalyticus TaxID=2665156 RepID=A0A857MK97_9BACT|nr:cation diffusion facilitator family transporter [Candidatus Mycosynbacter amalyticus]QHN43014.1 cation diffusion facilitator family transporter [Candidatus Mycosynbacter amalyticus]
MIGHGSTNTKALKISAALLLTYFIAEITVALVSGSLSLLADAAHELSTVVAISVSLVAIKLTHTKPTTKRTFGFRRAETIAALTNGVLLLGMAVFIIVRGLDRLANPVEMSAAPMFAMAIGGIGLEIASLVIMYRGQKENLNIRGSFWHVMNAFLGSIAVIIAAIFIEVGQVYEADTWAGLIFAIILIYAAYGIIRDALRILIDATPTRIDITLIDKDLKSIKGVEATHHLHARTVGGGIETFSGHLVVASNRNAQSVLIQAKQLLEKKYGFNLSTIQIEDSSLFESDPKEIEYKSMEKQA